MVCRRRAGGKHGVMDDAAGPGARELTPASWQWLERLARRNLGAETMWDGVRQMAAAGSPVSWNIMIQGRALVQANREPLAKP